LASAACVGRSGQEVHEMTRRSMLSGALKEGVRRLLKQPGRPVEVKIHPIPSHFAAPENPPTLQENSHDESSSQPSRP
jgi:hypothetical protein